MSGLWNHLRLPARQFGVRHLDPDGLETMNRFTALVNLERAFRDWYYETGQVMPDVGIVTIGVSSDGIDIQYLGNDPHMTVDWPEFFSRIVKRLDAGDYSVMEDAGVQFPSQR
jgi:hypothetical protein